MAPVDLVTIEEAVCDLISERPEAIVFGGARGTDTVALAAAWAALEGLRPPRLVVVVPRRIKDQPLQARMWARRCADQIVELKASRLDGESFHARNAEMIRRSNALVAFWDGHAGGTQTTIELAEEAGIPVEIVRLLGGEARGIGTEKGS